MRHGHAPAVSRVGRVGLGRVHGVPPPYRRPHPLVLLVDHISRGDVPGDACRQGPWAGPVRGRPRPATLQAQAVGRGAGQQACLGSCCAAASGPYSPATTRPHQPANCPRGATAMGVSTRTGGGGCGSSTDSPVVQSRRKQGAGWLPAAHLVPEHRLDAGSQQPEQDCMRIGGATGGRARHDVRS